MSNKLKLTKTKKKVPNYNIPDFKNPISICDSSKFGSIDFDDVDISVVKGIAFQMFFIKSSIIKYYRESKLLMIIEFLISVNVEVERYYNNCIAQFENVDNIDYDESFVFTYEYYDSPLYKSIVADFIYLCFKDKNQSSNLYSYYEDFLDYLKDFHGDIFQSMFQKEYLKDEYSDFYDFQFAERMNSWK